MNVYYGGLDLLSEDDESPYDYSDAERSETESLPLVYQGGVPRIPAWGKVSEKKMRTCNAGEEYKASEFSTYSSFIKNCISSTNRADDYCHTVGVLDVITGYIRDFKYFRYLALVSIEGCQQFYFEDMPQDATVRSRQKEIISLVLEKFEYKPFQLFNASIETIPELVEALLRLRSEQKEFAFDQFMTEYRAVRHLIDQDKGGDLDVKRGYVRMIRRLQSRFPKECELFSVEENLGFELIGRLDATIFKDLNKRWLKLKKDNKRVFLMDEIETAFDTISRQNKLSVPEIGRKEFNEKVDEFAKTELVDFSDAMKRNSNAFVKGAIRPGSDLFLRIQEQAHSPGNRNQVYKEMMLRSLLKLGKKVLQICKQFELCEHCLSRGHDSDDCRDLCYDLQEYINPSAYEETTDVRVSLNKRFVTASQWEKEDIILRVIRNKQRKRRRVE